MPLSKEEINELIIDTLDVGKRVLTAHKLVNSLENRDLQNHYSKELDQMMVCYYAMQYLMQKELEAYLSYERKNNLPITLTYQRLLNTIKD